MCELNPAVKVRAKHITPKTISEDVRSIVKNKNPTSYPKLMKK